jgi:hypothetical protein
VPGDAKYIVIGDSVAYQLFRGYENKDMLNLTTNQAISMAGQYVLLKSAIRNNPIKVVVMVFKPQSFCNDLDQKFTYNYFVRPFYTVENYQNFTPHTLERVKSNIFSMLFLTPFSKVSNIFSGIDYSLAHTDKSDVSLYLSGISSEYMRKIYDMCRENNIKIVLLSPVVSNSKISSYKFERLKTQIAENGLTDMFAKYFYKMLVLDDSYFLDDQVHLKHDSLARISHHYLIYYHEDLGVTR